MMELLLPRSCGGCGRAGVRWCLRCQRQWLAPPRRISTTTDPHVPVWSMGAFGQSRRRSIIHLKERGRRDLIPFISASVAAAVEYLIAAGELDHDAILVPAPTKRSSARKRGGDPVYAVCKQTGYRSEQALWEKESMRDSVGLDVAARRRNVMGKVELVSRPSRPVLLVDDVVTTGATIAESVAVLTSAGVKVRGALGWASS